MTYSLDFRQQVLKIREQKGLSIEAVSIVGKASVMRWLVNVEPKKTRNKPATKINMTHLQEDVTKYPDSFQYERAQRLGVSASGIRLALQRLKITYKKNLESSESRSC